MLHIKPFYFNPYRECTYIVTAKELSDTAQDCLIVDAGMYSEQEEQRFLDFMSKNHLTPVAILVTHAHLDHVCGLEFLNKYYPEAQLIDATHPASPSFAHSFRIIPTPGHTEDSVCYYFEDDKTLFTGDTLFQQSVGRTDLLGGDTEKLMRSLELLKQLPDDTAVYPGHGYSTTIGQEKQYNPYL